MAKENFEYAKECLTLSEKYEKMSKDNKENNDFIEKNFEKYDGSDFVENGEYSKAAKWYKYKAKILTEKANNYQLMDKKYSKQNVVAIEKLKDLHQTSVWNFEKGKIEIENSLYAGNKLQFPKSGSNKIDNDLIKYIPVDYLFLIGGNINIKDYYNFFKNISFGEFAKAFDDFEEILNSNNLKLDEVLNMFKGDFYFSLCDFDDSIDDIHFILSAKINNKKNINKLVNLLIEKKQITKENNSNSELFKITDGDATYYIIIKDDMFYITSDDIKEIILNNQDTFSIRKESIEINKTNSTISLLNISKILGIIYKNNEKQDEFNSFFIDLKNLISNFKYTSDTINTKIINSKCTIELFDTEKNSLNVFYNLIIDFLKKNKDKFNDNIKKTI